MLTWWTSLTSYAGSRVATSGTPSTPTVWPSGDPKLAAMAGAERLQRVRDRMAEVGVDVLLRSLGADLPWLTGYEAMPL